VGLGSPDWLASTDGSLWVKLDSGDVVRLDPSSGRTLARIRPPGVGSGLCQGFGATAEAVYACPYDGLVERIDVDTNRLAAKIAVPVVGDQGHLVTVGGRLWVITGAADEIRGIDTTTNEIGPPIPLGAACTELAAADPIVWAACPTEGRLLRIDTVARRVTGRVALPGARLLTADQMRVWVSYDDGVAQVDAERLGVQAVYQVWPGLGGGIYVDGDRVLLRSEGGPFLTVLDPARRKVVETITAPDLPSGGNVIRTGRSLWASASDDGTIVRLRAGAAP
jgi:DNA-binding beta-propeller fold protein YncE